MNGSSALTQPDQMNITCNTLLSVLWALGLLSEPPLSSLSLWYYMESSGQSRDISLKRQIMLALATAPLYMRLSTEIRETGKQTANHLLSTMGDEQPLVDDLLLPPVQLPFTWKLAFSSTFKVLPLSNLLYHQNLQMGYHHRHCSVT